MAVGLEVGLRAVLFMGLLGLEYGLVFGIVLDGLFVGLVTPVDGLVVGLVTPVDGRVVGLVTPVEGLVAGLLYSVIPRLPL